MVNAVVADVPGIVTVVRLSGGRGFYLQDPTPDANDATSEAIFVFTNVTPTVQIGDSVLVRGTVQEFRPGGSGGTSNLSTTQLGGSLAITTTSSGNPLPAATIIGTGGRIPPSEIIEDDASGDVETSGVFDPAQDGIDFYESMESMRVQVNNAVAVGPSNSFGEIAVVGDDGAHAGLRTPRGGIIIRPNDFNPERIILDDQLMRTPVVNVGDHFTTPVVGVLDYNFGNFKLYITQPLTPVSAGLAPEVAASTGAQELAVASYNVENLDPSDGAHFDELAFDIVNNLRSPDLLAVQEVQDNNGPISNTVTAADVTFSMLIAAIEEAGGPTYQYRQIDPVAHQDGGEPGGNIRVGFLFHSDRGLTFVDRPGGCSTCATSAVAGPGGDPQLTFSPGRVEPTNPAWNSSRKPLAGEFRFRGNKLFVVNNHLNSKSGDNPLFGRFQPPVLVSEVQRMQQAQILNNFVDSILALDANAKVIVLGDLNDFQFSNPIAALKGSPPVLFDLVDTLPENERYSYVFDGNSQTLDHILVSAAIYNSVPFSYDMVHINAEFAVRSSDHDPPLARFDLTGRTR
jgi:hypothetical protein